MKKPYQLRLDEDMIAEVKQLAEKNMRSVNSEFRTLLKKSLSETKKCGIYKITNPDGFYYIGLSKDISFRFESHILGNSTNTHLHNSILKFGVENHSYEILEECLEHELREKELFYIKNSDHNFLLNSLGCDVKKEVLKTKNTIILDPEKMEKLRGLAVKNKSGVS